MNRLAVLIIAVGLLASWSHAQQKIVFITSESTNGAIIEGLSSGIAAADAICNRLAGAAGLDMTNGTYLAWLSDNVTSPDQRFTKATVPYVLTTGTKVADNYADLTDGSLDAPIDREEDQTPAGLDAWTGTLANGTRDPLGGFNTRCSEWTFGTAATQTGLEGVRTAMDGT